MLSHGHNSYRNSYKTFKTWISPTNGSRKLASGNQKSPKNLKLAKQLFMEIWTPKKGTSGCQKWTPMVSKKWKKKKKKALEEMKPHLLFFPIVKLQKTSHSYQYQTSVQSIWLYIKQDMGASFFWGLLLFFLYVFILHMSQRILQLQSGYLKPFPVSTVGMWHGKLVTCMTTRLKMTCILGGRWYVSDPFSSLVMWGTHNELPEG